MFQRILGNVYEIPGCHVFHIGFNWFSASRFFCFHLGFLLDFSRTKNVGIVLEISRKMPVFFSGQFLDIFRSFSRFFSDISRTPEMFQKVLRRFHEHSRENLRDNSGKLSGNFPEKIQEFSVNFRRKVREMSGTCP